MQWIVAMTALAYLICLPFFMHYKAALRYSLAAAYKTLGTLCAAALALTAALRLEPACWVCFAALLLHAAADWIIEFNLYLGAGFFLAGHVCYIGFFTTLYPVSSFHLIAAVILLGTTAFVFYRFRVHIGKRLPMFSVYAAVLSVTCACAVGCISSHMLPGILIAVGGALFYLSDALLLGRLLFSATRPVDWTIMITYYAAQLLIGASCMLR